MRQHVFVNQIIVVISSSICRQSYNRYRPIKYVSLDVILATLFKWKIEKDLTFRPEIGLRFSLLATQILTVKNVQLDLLRVAVVFV